MGAEKKGDSSNGRPIPVGITRDKLGVDKIKLGKGKGRRKSRGVLSV